MSFIFVTGVIMIEISFIDKETEVRQNLSNILNSSREMQENGKNQLQSSPFWLARNFSLWYRKPYQWKLKRIIDITATMTGIVLISPILILLAIAIKLDSKGPIFFKQKRVGLYGREFYMYKFRSMRSDAEKNLEMLAKFNETNDIMFKMTEDPRITRVGKFIRKFSLDELPQLFNVIKGEMSLVGPRPPIMREVERYDKWHYLKFATLPGLTGMWQVSGRSKIKEFDYVIKLDYRYIDNWDLKLDLWLLLKTIPVVIMAKRAS